MYRLEILKPISIKTVEEVSQPWGRELALWLCRNAPRHFSDCLLMCNSAIDGWELAKDTVESLPSRYKKWLEDKGFIEMGPVECFEPFDLRVVTREEAVPLWHRLKLSVWDIPREYIDKHRIPTDRGRSALECSALFLALDKKLRSMGVCLD